MPGPMNVVTSILVRIGTANAFRLRQVDTTRKARPIPVRLAGALKREILRGFLLVDIGVCPTNDLPLVVMNSPTAKTVRL